MDVRLIAAAAVVVLVSACSSATDTADFLASPGRPTTGAKFSSRDLTAALDPDAPIPPASDETAKDAKADATDAKAATADATAKTPAIDPSAPVEAAAKPAPTGIFAFFMSPDKKTPAEVATETETTSAKAEDAAAKPATAETTAETPPASEAAPVEASADAPDEVSEADLAGEQEADPNQVAVPEEPFDDGQEHDFVNVYSSRPDKPEEMIGGLPGVEWPNGMGVASLGSSDNDGSLFGGEDHPFARTVPGIPQRVIQAANGLLLANSSINVDCVKPALLSLVRRAETNFGHKAVITSGYRSPAHNRRVHGATHSQHMFCNALDLYMPGVSRDELARFFFAQPDRGGLGLYCHTKSIHVDTGRRRQWRWSCRRRAG